MWAVALRILAGLGIGEVLNFFKPDEEPNDASAGIVKILVLIIVLIVLGFGLFWFFGRKK